LAIGSIRRLIERNSNEYFDSAVDQIRTSFHYFERLQIVYYLYKLALSDWVLHRNEEVMIMEIIDALELDKHDVELILAAREQSVAFQAHPRLSTLTEPFQQGESILFVGSDTHADFLIHHNSSVMMAAIIKLGEVILIQPVAENFVYCDQKPLSSGCTYSVIQDQTIAIKGFILDLTMMGRLFEERSLRMKQDLLYQNDDISFQIFRTGTNHFLKNLGQSISLNQKKIRKNQRIRLFFPVDIEFNGNVLLKLDDLSFWDWRRLSDVSRRSSFYINYLNGRIERSLERHSDTIAGIEWQGKYFILTPQPAMSFQVNGEIIQGSTKILPTRDLIDFQLFSFALSEQGDILYQGYKINQVQIDELHYQFQDKNIGLDHLSFAIDSGHLMAIMGPSGCGKTTLLKMLVGEYHPTDGDILLNGISLYKDFIFFKRAIGYVPQEDLLFENLTVYENLYYFGRLYLPNNAKDDINRRINMILNQIRLADKRDLLVGSIADKRLSGGERKRLNIGIEALYDPSLFILDEPTSGLSSSDSEQVMNLLGTYQSQGKIIIVTIHQPSSSLLNRFDRLLLLDKGGKQVYFGSVADIFNYFDDELALISRDKEILSQQKQAGNPEYIFHILEYRKSDAHGDSMIQLDQLQHTHLIRQFPPDYWRQKYQKKMIYSYFVKDAKNFAASVSIPASPGLTQKFGQFHQFKYLFIRNFKNKLRDRLNVIITFIQAPLLAIVISYILRYSVPGQEYSYRLNINAPIFLFISIIIFIFSGLMNSIEEILSEKRAFFREKNLGRSNLLFLLSKIITLSIFGLIGISLFLIFSNLIIGVGKNIGLYVSYFFLSYTIGFSAGLLISAFISGMKAAYNFVPMILIPQIIFSGALISFEDMNLRVKVFDEDVIPEFCQLMPSRWIFEGLYTGEAKLNPFVQGNQRILAEKVELNRLLNENSIDFQNFKIKLELLQNNQNRFLSHHKPDRYVNEKIQLTIDAMDSKALRNSRNYFLSSFRQWGSLKISTWYLNALVVVLYALVLNCITFFRLKRMNY